MYIIEVYSIHLHWDKTQMLKKISVGQNKRYKKCIFFFHKLQLIIILVLICNSYKVYIFVQQKAWTLWVWNIIIPFEIKLIEKPYTFSSQTSVF